MSKHLSLNNRLMIQQGLFASKSLRQIARELKRSVSVISREIRKHRRQHDSGAFGRVKNRCIHRASCAKVSLCISRPDCTRHCASCGKCNAFCIDFQEQYCQRLDQSPYVCNGCKDKPACVLRKQLYDAQAAQREYEENLRLSRSGFNITAEELADLDDMVSPLIRSGQSVKHIFMTQRDSLIRSSRTVYRLIHANAISARAIDMPRLCRLKPRRSQPNPLKVDKRCREGRSYSDYLSFRAAHPDCPIVQMDSVIGKIGGKVFLTLHLTSFDFMIAILRDRNTAHSVAESLLLLRDALSPTLFSKLFPVLLTDNGCEFSNPSAIEFIEDGKRSTRVFYCDPQAPYQKANVELNHEFIRRFLPKGTSFDSLSQEDVSLMMSHINSYAREKFGGLSPAQMLVQAFGSDALRLLGQALIPAKQIILNNSIFHK